MNYLSLISKYPHLFPSTNSHPSCGLGWLPIIQESCKFLNNQHNVHFSQIKEKFGSIRLYTNSVDPSINSFLYAMESISSHICETCGSPGSIQSFPYLKCQCPSCAHNLLKIQIFK